MQQASRLFLANPTISLRLRICSVPLGMLDCWLLFSFYFFLPSPPLSFFQKFFLSRFARHSLAFRQLFPLNIISVCVKTPILWPGGNLPPVPVIRRPAPVTNTAADRLQDRLPVEVTQVSRYPASLLSRSLARGVLYFHSAILSRPFSLHSCLSIPPFSSLDLRSIPPKCLP
ncbi:hypothetical protein ASPBRDRAFT_456088 [Aspergillus brasiliensis CBS 101740]|uniref:Transmembrane protein n=1 Tax=Aspergillus brasiliensis (strain CBS 101740 / IMI 381727 / IBT 21946) TaxID=767769 RepID=A0A1L9USQ6_ASPBC|nr:hypothetical protein ASPBRDRAFT_456088 [Aspergillus brasiliensis CBS 101740]